MRKRQQTWIIHGLYLLMDFFCIYLAMYLALVLRQGTVPFVISWSGFFSSSNPFKMIFLLWVPVILLFNQFYGLYHTRREMLESLEIWRVIKSVALSSLVIIVMAYLLKIQDFPRTVTLLGAVFISVLLSFWRVFKKLLVNFLVRQGYNNFNILIVGAGKIGGLLMEEIRKRPELGLKVVGFLDDEKRDPATERLGPVLGKLENFQDVVHRQFIHKVFITIYPDHCSFIKLLEAAKTLDVATMVVPQGYEYMARDFSQYNIGIIPVLEYSDVGVNYRQKGKRIFDCFLSALLLIVLFPLLVVIAVLITRDSPGPILYRSKRYGRNGRIFNMYKFRTMVANADELLEKLKDKNEVDGPIFKIKKDPRITAMGMWLRKFSLDELPQILNVVQGDMSLVGPRPLPIEQIEKEDLRQLKRLGIRPGITGLWQIRGRSDVSFDRLLRWDIWYINNWSFWLDLYILLQTFPVVIKGKGAY